jgi:hypothetical protein
MPCNYDRIYNRMLLMFQRNILIPSSLLKILQSYAFYLLSLFFGPPLWSIGQCSWLQLQRYGFDSRRYQIFWEVVCLELGSLSLVSQIEELLDRKCCGSDLESREYGCRDPSRWPHDTLYPQKVGTHFADKRRSLGRYSSLADWGHGVFFNLRLWIPKQNVPLKHC